VSHPPDYAPAFIVFTCLGIALIAVGVIVVTNLSGLGQRWIESAYVYGPSKADGSDRPLEQVARRYRLRAWASLMVGLGITYQRVSAIFFA
jgi:hypothetical protein